MEPPGYRCAWCRDAGLSWDELAARAGVDLGTGPEPGEYVADVEYARALYWPATPPGHADHDG